ncbi:unnamed protein product [Adineta steineri]|uniref:Galactose-1-phosphate uridylyltransferase n=1 Tax=Adineta steineri TaxID=433720 RepID=A0A814FLF0_9BILA|nr:unnamed protein product [Adineta steineri]CAF1147374.1 unnamed protein product [Adineta steineri]CAF1155673.1 unnamed protein product [Adineta steineri]
MNFDRTKHSHCRYNPLKDEWILVSPQRLSRPWQGRVEDDKNDNDDDSDINSNEKPTNPLCPGAIRGKNNQQNPFYEHTYVFENDYPALLADIPDPKNDQNNNNDDLFQCHAARGVCKVMCFHPNSKLTLPRMTLDHISHIVKTWIEVYRDLASQYQWVQIFENRGDVMGCSNPHPHCQIWATDFLPNEARIKHRTQKDYFLKHNGNVLLLDYIKRELNDFNKERVVIDNEHWIVVVPYWAVWPYETMLLPKRHVLRLSDLSDEEQKGLGEIMKQLLIKYDNLFNTSFPYSMGWHGAPTGDLINEDCSYWQLHALYYPPLVRSATIKKFMVGFEMLAQVQRDITPEFAAETLRNLSGEIHYKDKKNT